MLVHRVDNPADTGVVSDGGVVGINHDDLVILVGSILVHPVTVEYPQVGTCPASTLLCHTAQVAHKLKLGDTLVLGLTVHDTLVVGSLAATTTNSATIDNITLLGLVTQLVCLLRTSRAGNFLHLLALAIFPGTEMREEREGNVCMRYKLITPVVFQLVFRTVIIEQRTEREARNASRHSASCATSPPSTYRHP